MNSFRSAILTGKGLHPADPVLQQKKKRGAKEDDLSTVPVARQEHRTLDTRDDDRHRLEYETARARFAGEERDVDVINLSGGGAMIRCDFTPRLWERVDLIFTEGAEIECAVRWIRADRVGLEFAHETRIDCEPEARDRLLLDVIQRSFPDVALAPREQVVPPLPTEKAEQDKDEAIANSRRTDRRHPLVWMGEILFSHSSEKVRLRNISERGALIESPVPYPVGAEVLLDLGNAGQHFSTVSWTCGDKIGLKFNDAFDLRLLGSTKPEIAPQLMIRPGPGGRLSVDRDNPWADGWKRQSLEDLRSDLEGYLKR